MPDRNHQLAAEFCGMVEVDSLQAFLGVAANAAADDVKAALKKKRTWYQSMQANPKHRERARWFIKHYRALEAAVVEPTLHLSYMEELKVSANLPMLEMVIDGVLYDGVITPSEEAFLRENAMNLGVGRDVYERVLRERCDRKGVTLDARGSMPPLPSSKAWGQTIDLPRMKPGTGGSGWWDDAFSDLLLSHIPEETERLVDIAAGAGWGALTILPHRQQLEYLGIDDDPARLEYARKSLRATPLASRVALLPGQPHKLPLKRGTVDAVLCVMAMHKFRDNGLVLREAKRALRLGGRLVVVEPDRSATRFWFNGPLDEINQSWERLVAVANRAIQGQTRASHAPSFAAGPLMGARMLTAGLVLEWVQTHHIQECRVERATTFADRVATEVATLARSAKLSSREPTLQAVNTAIDRFEAGADRTDGAAVLTTPLFLTVGVEG